MNRDRLRHLAAILIIFVAGFAARSVPPPGAHDRWPCLLGVFSPEECGACGVRCVRLVGASIQELRRAEQRATQEQAEDRAAKDRAPSPTEAPPMAPEPRPLPPERAPAAEDAPK